MNVGKELENNAIKLPMVNKIKDIIETLFRWFAFPTEPGLRKCGNPGRDSPVFLTTNFDMTVRKVKQALKEQSCYLLVANTRGINVWCAAVGASFTAQHVISAIKTSGIAELVDHRRVILPQLAAPGVDAGAVKEATGWDVVFGPVYAKFLPRYIENNFSKSKEMSLVRSTLSGRLEMAVSWSWMLSLICSVPGIIWFRDFFLLLLCVIWVTTFLVFSLWHYLPGRLGIIKSLFVGFIFMLGATISNISQPLGDIFRLDLGIFLISLMVGADAAGSNPVWRSRFSKILEKVSLHRILGSKEGTITRVEFDESKCVSCQRCISVCPRGCFRINIKTKKINMIEKDKCVQCGACVKQCSGNAFSLERLSFK